MPTAKVYLEQGGDSLVIASGAKINIKSGGDLQIAGIKLNATATELDKLNSVTAGTVTASKAIVVGSSKEIDILKFKTGSAAVGVGTILGGGTSANPLTTATATHFIEWQTESTGTSGTTRAMYVRLYSNGAGQDNDAVRFFHTTQKALTGAHGAHISCDFDADGSVTGLATGLRATLHVPDRALAANGTYFGMQAEIYCEGNSSDISPVTKHAILSLTVSGGNSTARNLVKNMLSVTGPTGSGNMVYINTGTDPTNSNGSLRIDVDGVAFYIMLYSQQAA